MTVTNTYSLPHFSSKADSDPSVYGCKYLLKDVGKIKHANSLSTLPCQRQDTVVFSFDFFRSCKCKSVMDFFGSCKYRSVVIVGDSVVRNVPSRSLNQSLKEYFSVVKSFPGATTQDMKDYIKPTISRKPDMVILHTVTNDLKSNQNPSDIPNEIFNLAKNIKNSGTEVSISSLIPRRDRLSEKGKKVNKELQEKCTAENFAFIFHKNINSTLDLFPDKLHPNKKGQGIIKGNFRKFINEYV